MFHIVLYEPEIPPNTGNIIRLCANTGARLSLIKPLGFELEDKQLRRAGLDYHEYADVEELESFNALLNKYPEQNIYACSTKGNKNYSSIDYQPGDLLLFGPETSGLPAEVRQHDRIIDVVRIAMKKDSRSLNLSNSVAIILYEAWRQQGFKI